MKTDVCAPMLETKEPDLAPVKATEPAKRWKNRWRASKDVILATLYCQDCGTTFNFQTGDEFIAPHCAAYPSRDVAETAAEIDLSEGFNIFAEYIGAEPQP